MKTRFIFSLLIAITILLSSCGPSAYEKAKEQARLDSLMAIINYCYSSSYTKVFPKRNINITNAFGDELSILVDGDTINYNFSFNRKTKLNYIIEDDDTIFKGSVSRFKGIYYLSEVISVDTVLIFALKIKGDSIVGLYNNYLREFNIPFLEQECNLTDLIDENKMNNILVSPNSYRLNPDKKVLDTVYKNILKGLDYYKIIDRKQTEASIDTITAKTDVKTLEERNSTIIKAYPNPTTDYCNFQFEDALDADIVVSNESGQILSKTKNHDISCKIDFSKYKTGIYFVQFYFPETEEKQTVKVIKK